MADGNAPMLGSSGLDKYSNLPGNSTKTKAEMELEQKTKKDINDIKKSSISRTPSDDDSERHEVKKIVTGSKKKKPLSTRFKETFLSEESDGIGSFILWDLLIPAAKDTFYDLVMGVLGISLYGDSSSRGGRGGNRRSSNVIRGGYRDYAASSKVSNRDDDRRYGRRNRRFVDDIAIPDTYDNGRRIPARTNAMDVLKDMQDLIVDYGRCTVADYYGMVGQDWDPMDKNWGWTNLDRVTIKMIPGGDCILDLPQIEQV